MTKMKKVLLLGYYGANNLGDDMMLYSILPWLQKQNFEVTVITESPTDTARRFKTAAIPNIPMMGQWNWRSSWLRGGALKLLGHICRHDMLVVGGGDLIRDDKGWKTFSYTMEKIVLTLLLGKPVYMVNIGINNPVTFYGKAVLRWVLRRTRKVITRDQRTFNLCKDIAGSKVFLLPDIVVKLPKTFEVGGNPAGKKAYIIVSLREDPDVFQQYPFSIDHVMALAKVLDMLSVQQCVDIIFVPFHGGGSHNDNVLHEQVAGYMKEKARVTVREWTPDFVELLTWISHARMVLGMRLHAIVLAIGCRRPCLAMPYDHKIYQFADLVKLKEFVTSDQLLDTEFTANALSRLCQTEADYDLRWAEKWESLRLNA
jgi:polysaccharide pyruvyl transferase CsaB